MKRRAQTILWALTLTLPVIAFGAEAVSISAATRGKKLIDYGWGSPDTAYYRAHLKELEAIPFDGLVISAMKLKGNDPPDNMGWCAFGSEARFTSQDCQHAIDDLKAAKSKRFQHNFIQVVTSGNVDWFDFGWPQIATNVALLARIAKQGGCKGIMLDAEQYDRFRMWTYATLPEKLKAAHSFEEYQAKVRDRGREFIRAINGEYKDLTILMLFGPSLTHRAQGKGMLKDSHYSLLAPFCDGMAEAATPKTTIIDGYEFSYGYRSAEQFADGRKTILDSVNKSLNPQALRKHLRVGFGIWADNDSLRRGWHPEDFSKNYFTPAQLRTSLNHALNASDEYVWVYSERLKWWKGTPPKEYVEALALARQAPDPREVQREAGLNRASGGFAYPVSTANRRFIDQTGKIYLLKTMSSWAMSQNCSDAEITQALEGLKALKFNAITVSPFGVHMNDSFGDRYKNKAGQSFFNGKPHASALGPAWSSMDWVMREATRLEMTVVFSFFLSWKDTGTVPDMIAGGTTNAYEFGKAVATRYASYSNIVWHVMGDYKWRYNEGPSLALDAIFHGIRDAEGARHRLIIAEPSNGSTSFDQFISAEGADGYKWFKQSADTIYHYGSNSVAQFDKLYNRPGAASYPLVDIEPPYVNAPHYKGQQKQELRERNYATFIRGGAGINFGHEKWWPHGVTGLFDGGPGWLNILNEAPQLDAKHAWTILDAHVTDPTWMPDAGTFLKSGLGSGDDQAASGYSSSAALVYFPTSRPIIIDTTKIARGSKVRLRWYDPTSGNYTMIASSEAKTADRSVSYPAKPHADGFNDWLLIAEGLLVAERQ